MVLGFFFLNQIKPHSAYWHFNTNLLCSKDFKDYLKYFGKSLKRHKIHLKTYSNGGILERSK